eukprot:935374-Prorocentrum_minimum.AAC.1
MAAASPANRWNRQTSYSEIVHISILDRLSWDTATCVNFPANNIEPILKHAFRSDPSARCACLLVVWKTPRLYVQSPFTTLHACPTTLAGNVSPTTSLEVSA